jgi:hypothetical protein
MGILGKAKKGVSHAGKSIGHVIDSSPIPLPPPPPPLPLPPPPLFLAPPIKSGSNSNQPNDGSSKQNMGGGFKIDLNGKKKKGGGPLGMPQIGSPNIGKALGGVFSGAGGLLTGITSGASSMFGGLLGGASSSITTPLLIGGVVLAGVVVYGLNRGSSVAERALDNPESLRILAQAAAGPEMAAASMAAGALR